MLLRTATAPADHDLSLNLTVTRILWDAGLSMPLEKLTRARIVFYPYEGLHEQARRVIEEIAAALQKGRQ